VDGLVDTSIAIDLDRGYAPSIQWMQNNPTLLLGITPMVWMEAMLGVGNRAGQRRIAKLLQRFHIVYLIQSDMDWAMQRFPIYALSHGVGVVDCLIAAPAHRLQLPLYTRNLKHFTPLLGNLAQQPY